mgnify:CR=1 FL=1
MSHVNSMFWIVHFGHDKGMKMQLVIQQVTAYVEHQYILLIPSREKLREFKKLIIKRRSMMGVSVIGYINNFSNACFTIKNILAS